jgi:hypothetical protein
MKKVKTMSVEELRYVIKDCNEAMQSLPCNINNGYYADEVHYCSMELVRRKKQ